MKKDVVPLLWHLRTEGRKHLTAIARKEKIPPSTVHDRFRRLDDVVERYTCLLDYPAMGFPHRTFFFCSHRDPHLLVKAFERLPHTNAISLTDRGIMADLIFKSAAAEEQTINHLKEMGCDILSTHRIVAPVVVENWMPDENLFPDRKSSGESPEEAEDLRKSGENHFEQQTRDIDGT